MDISLTPRNTTGHLQPNSNYVYIINFTSDIDCENVLLTNNFEITTDIEGTSSVEISLDNLTSIPNYICEYRNGTLRETHNFTSNILDKMYLNNINLNQNITLIQNNTSFLGSLTKMLKSIYATTIYESGIKLSNKYRQIIDDRNLSDADIRAIGYLKTGNTTEQILLSTRDLYVNKTNAQIEGNLTFSNTVLGWINNLRGITTLSNSVSYFQMLGNNAAYLFRNAIGNSVMSIKNGGVVIYDMLNITGNILMFNSKLTGAFELNSTYSNSTTFTENGTQLESKYRQIIDDRNLTDTDISNLGYIKKDTNSSTECDGDNVLLGNTTCLSITDIGISSTPISTYRLSNGTEFSDTSGTWDTIIIDTFGTAGIEIDGIIASAQMKDTADTSQLRIRINDTSKGYLLYSTGWVSATGAGAKPTYLIDEFYSPAGNTFIEQGSSYVTKYTMSKGLYSLVSAGTLTIDFKRGTSGTAYVKDINITIRYR